MTIVALKKQTGFNQDFEFRCFGGKYQVLFFNQVTNRTNSKQEKNQDSLPPTFILHFLKISDFAFLCFEIKKVFR